MKNGLIAYSGRDQMGHQNIFLTDEGSSYHRQITFGPDNACPSWSPDGKMLAYVARDPASKRARVCVMNADGSDARPIADGNMPEWSPDGRILFAIYISGKVEMWRMNADGSNQRRITGSTAGPLPGYASWQPIP